MKQKNKNKNKKQIYASPVSSVEMLELGSPILQESYYPGGGGSYSDEEMIDNGNY